MRLVRMLLQWQVYLNYMAFPNEKTEGTENGSRGFPWWRTMFHLPPYWLLPEFD